MPVVGLLGEAGVEAAPVQLKAEDVEAEAVGLMGDQAQPRKRKRRAAGEGAPTGSGPANGAKVSHTHPALVLLLTSLSPLPNSDDFNRKICFHFRPPL